MHVHFERAFFAISDKKAHEIMLKIPQNAEKPKLTIKNLKYY